MQPIWQNFGQALRLIKVQIPRAVCVAGKVMLGNLVPPWQLIEPRRLGKIARGPGTQKIIVIVVALANHGTSSSPWRWSAA